MSRLQKICLGLLLLLLVATRFYDLGALPLFNDQATYVRWSQIMLDYPSPHNYFISTIDGKQPLSIWLNAIATPFFSSALIAERVMSAFFGIGIALLGGYFLARRFSKNAALVFLFLALTSPYLLWYSRYLLVETLTVFMAFASFMALWELYTTKKNINLAGLFLALFLVAGYFSKAPIVLAMAASFAFPFVFNEVESFERRLITHVAAIAAMVAVPIGLGLTMPYLGLPFIGGASQFATHIDLAGATGGYLASILSKLAEAWSFAHWYVGLPLIFLFVFSTAVLLKKREPLATLSLSFVIVPVLCIVAVIPDVRHLFIRYFLICIPFLFLPVAVYFGRLLDKGERVSAFLAVLFLATLLPATLSLKILKDPAYAPLHPSHKAGFVEGWTSGYGVAEAADYIVKESAGAKTIALTNFRWGNPGDGIAVTLWRSGVVVADAWWEAKMPVVPETNFRFALYESKYTRRGRWKPVEIVRIGDYDKVFFVCGRSTCVPDEENFLKRNPNFKLIKKFKKPSGDETVNLYQWNGKSIMDTGGKVLWFRDILKEE